MSEILNKRKPEYPVDEIFIDRWSPRAYSSMPVSEEEILTLFEAAKWSPSCFNEQPWMFLYAAKEEDLKIYRSILAEKNQEWANKAPLLVILLAKRKFESNGNINNWAEFDCGSAWMSLTLQATELGLYAHAMAGFSQDDVYEKLNINKDEYKPMVVIAVGHLGDVSGLSPDMGEREKPGERKPLSKIVTQGIPHSL